MCLTPALYQQAQSFSFHRSLTADPFLSSYRGSARYIFKQPRSDFGVGRQIGFTNAPRGFLGFFLGAKSYVDKLCVFYFFYIMYLGPLVYTHWLIFDPFNSACSWNIVEIVFSDSTVWYKSNPIRISFISWHTWCVGTEWGLTMSRRDSGVSLWLLRRY